MQRKIHPNHASITRWILFGLFLLVMSSYAVVMYAQEILLNQMIVNYSATVGLVSMILFLAILLFRALICRCPVCKQWLTKQEKVNIDNETRKFICKKCNIIWDSKVQLAYGSN